MKESAALFNRRFTINCKGSLLDFTSTRIMGILNITPDSFFTGQNGPLWKDGKLDEEGLLRQASGMIKDGASILDLGGMSSRPGAQVIPLQEEMKRLLPVVEIIHKAFPDILISVDTIRHEIAREAIEKGAHIINDISAGEYDPMMIPTIAALKVPYIVMHMQGMPENMQVKPEYKQVVVDVADFFIRKIEQLQQAGVNDIILDPGFGFGKTLVHNYELLHRLDAFQIFGFPVMVGLSRKSMVCKVVKTKPEKALNGTTALHMQALMKGANLLRVHDVRQAKEVIRIASFYQKANNL